MGWIIFFAAIIGFFVLRGIFIQKSYNDRLKQNPDLISTYLPKYAGGLDFVTGGREVLLSVNKDNINLNFNKPINNNLPEVTINYEDIINLSIKTESQIQKDISIAGLLTLGALHLATNKTKNVYTNFLIIEYKENEENKHVLLAHQYLQVIYNEINTQLKLQKSTVCSTI